jgi:hypothetical protein
MTPIDGYHVDVAILRQFLLDSFDELRRFAELVDQLETITT